MNAATLPRQILPAAAPSLIGDYTLRAPDFDTLLVGPITDSIIDADRLVRREWSNGFPNFALYRAALAGDSVYVPRLRAWCVAFAIAYCESGGVRRDAYSDELACVAAWDALHLLLYSREIAPYSVLAADVGIKPKSYRRIRDAIYIRLRESVMEYWARLGSAYRITRLRERHVSPMNVRCGWSEGRGFGHELDIVGDGNFRAYIPKG